MNARDSIAAAIAEAYSAERCSEELADTLSAVALEHRLADHHVLLWIHDLPRHELSSRHLLLWAQRLGFLR